MQNLLSKIYRIIDSEIDPAFAQRARFVIDHIWTHRPARILDVGCGRGYYVKLVSMLPFVKEIVGIDRNADYLKKAQNTVGSDPRVTLDTGSIYHLPFKDNYFDCIIASEILEHLDDNKQAVIELHRVLKKGGMLLVTVPNKNYPFLWDPLNWMLERVFKTHINKNIWWLAGIWADHEQLYSEHDIKLLLNLKFKISNLKLSIHWCWPFSHFLLYGIGKNIVERLGAGSFDRFNFKKQKPLSRFLAKLFALPSDIFDSRIPTKRAMNILVAARKD